MRVDPAGRAIPCGQLGMANVKRRVSGSPPDIRRGERPAQRAVEAGVGVQSLDRLRGGRADHRAESELQRLGDAALGVCDVAQLAGQSDLAEARTWLAGGVANR